MHDLDREDRFQRFAEHRERATRVAKLDVEELIAANIVGSLMLAQSMDLSTYERAAVTQDNQELLLLVRGVAAYRASTEKDFGTKQLFQSIATPPVSRGFVSNTTAVQEF